MANETKDTPAPDSKPSARKDIGTSGPGALNWDNANPAESLEGLRTFVEKEAQETINWYWREKNRKRAPSRGIQFAALALTAAAGLAPIIFQIAKPYADQLKNFDSGPVASLLVGLAAALLGLDKAFGFSSGWTRYVLTATSMTKVLHEFRMDWLLLYSELGDPPKPEQEAKLIQRAKQFAGDIQGALLEETKQWANEFQSNSAQMEKDVRGQLDALKSQVEKVSKEREEAQRPGGIELSIPNADKADGFQVAVVLQGTHGAQTETLANSKVWTQIGTAPGQYKVAVAGKSGGSPFGISTIFEVKPGEVAKPSITLPI